MFSVSRIEGFMLMLTITFIREGTKTFRVRCTYIRASGLTFIIMRKLMPEGSQAHRRGVDAMASEMPILIKHMNTSKNKAFKSTGNAP